MSDPTFAIIILLVVNVGLSAILIILTMHFSDEAKAWRQERAQLLDRVQAPDVAAASAPMRMNPRPVQPPKDRKVVRGRAGIGVVIKEQDEDG